MKKAVFKNELYKAFVNKKFLAVILIETIFVIAYTITDVRSLLNSYNFDMSTMWGNKPPYFLAGAVSGWLPFSGQYRIVAFAVLPILVAFPYGGNLYMEQQSHYNTNVILRCGKKLYYRYKLIVMFISGVAAVRNEFSRFFL